VVKQKVNKKQLQTLVISTLVLCFFVSFGAKQALALSAPTALTPKVNQQFTPNEKITVSGVAANNSTVYVFVDGKLLGGIKAKNGKNGTASLQYILPKTFAVGEHALTLQAVSGKVKSPYSAPLKFVIPKKMARLIDGVIVDSAQAKNQSVAVMIENMSVVRPQAGLASASVVYETLAEGGIPRFLAIFDRTDMPKVGPVRSARPYYIDWAKEYGSIYLHAGGSRDAFNEIGRYKLRSIDALVSKTAKYFNRTKAAAPHNLFTTGAKLATIKKDFKTDTLAVNFDTWKFKDEIVLAKRPNEKRQLIIDFKSGSQYVVAYKYDKASNSYLRFNGGKAHTDANYAKSTQIKVKNVIVQVINKEKVLDNKKRIELDITGTGKGFLMLDGKLQNITWKRANMNSRTRFYYANGQEVELNRGNTWIEVVPKDRPVLYK
jgi:hypothetical protein